MSSIVSLSGLKKIKPVHSGGTIGVIATGSPSSPERFHLGVTNLEKLGFKVRSPFDPTKYYGKSDHGFASENLATRQKALHSLIADPEVQAILAVRGAYGTLDVLPSMDFPRLETERKAIIGCSDVTALLAQAFSKGKIPAIHGATLASSVADYFSDAAAKESVDALFAMLQAPDFRWQESVKILRPGKGTGPVICGNLTMFLTLLGTPWDFDYSGAILVVEDVGEAPYRIHRAFTQLSYAGKLAKLQGLVFGRFVRCESAHGPSIEQVFELIVRDILRGTTFPVASGLSVGHYGKNMPLAWGCGAELKDGEFCVLESPIA